MTNMRKWSVAKLAKEVAFARSAKDEGHPENLAWLEACEAEVTRRYGPQTDGPYWPDRPDAVKQREHKR